jgi:SH3 domain-containing protein
MHDVAPFRRSPWRVVFAVVLTAACSSPKPQTAVVAPPAQVKAVVVHDTVAVRDPDMDRRVARLDLRLMEKETQVDELQTRLDDARDEVVRTMAKLQTLASRAEAASAMAEADVAVQSLRTTAAGQQVPEIAQSADLVKQSNAEFGKQNFGGALYLANQAKAIATTGRARATAGSRGPSRAGETQFALPIRIKVANRGNVREGPGTGFAVTFPVSSGDQLTAYSFTEDWVRVSDDSGRAGWIFRTLVTRP